MNNNIIYQQPYIKIINSEEKICLVIEDTELNDYIEDYLCDNYNITYDYIKLDNHIYYNYFEEKISSYQLISIIQEIDKKEIEQIYKLNN